jgi:hypothetical protein
MGTGHINRDLETAVSDGDHVVGGRVGRSMVTAVSRVPRRNPSLLRLRTREEEKSVGGGGKIQPRETEVPAPESLVAISGCDDERKT